MKAEESARAQSLWRNPQFVVLWTGQTVSALGSSVSSIAYVLLIISITGSPVKAGLVGSISAATVLILRLPAGVVADRWNKFVVMMVSDVGRSIALSSLPVAALLWQITFTHVVVVAIVEGALGSFFWPAEVVAVRRVVKFEQLPEAAARNEARSYIATLVGPSLGGALFGAGRTVPFLVDAVSYALSAVALFFIRGSLAGKGRSAENDEITPRDGWRSIGKGILWIWREPFVRGAVVWSAGISFVFSSIGLVTIVLAQRYTDSAAAVGLSFSIASAGGLVGAALAPRLVARYERRTLILGFGWVASVATPLLCVAHSPYLIGAIGALAFFLGPAANAAVVGYVMTHCHERIQGRVSASMYFITGLALPVGPSLAGYLLERFGPVATVAIFSTFLVFLAVMTTFARGLRAVDSPVI